MAAELLRPGVTVLQTAKTTSPTFVRPTLAPCVVGPAFEVINVLSTDGTINPKALYGAYTQVGKIITESSFPDPRGNIDELNINESSVRPFLLNAGSLTELVMRPTGGSFLATAHTSSKAAVLCPTTSAGTGFTVNGKTLILAVDNPVVADTSKDITVLFSSSGGNLSSQNICDQINAAVGSTTSPFFATVVGVSPSDKVQLTSTKYGALSSITVRKSGSANTALGLSTLLDERISGAGWRGQDDNNNDTITPWVEFFKGAYYNDSITPGTLAPVVSLSAYVGQVTLAVGSANTFANSLASAVTFGTSGTFPLQVGDYFFADGTKVKNGEIMKVESSRFKIGTINSTLSTVDSNGYYINKVYDTQQVGTPYDTNAFNPTYAYFYANGLNGLTATPTAASVTGTLAGLAAQAAVVTGGTTSISSTAMGGLTLHLITTINGVATEQIFTITGGPFTALSDVVTYLTGRLTGITPSLSSTKLVLSTTLTGRLQSVTVKADGTANTLLGFSTSSDTSATGVDVSFPAMVMTSGQLATSLTLSTLLLKTAVSTDGGATWGATRTHTFTAITTIAAVVSELNLDETGFNTSSTHDLIAELSGTELRIRSLSSAANMAVKVIFTGSTALGTNHIYFSASADTIGYSLSGQSVQFTLSNCPHIYTASLSDNSLDLAIAEINLQVGGLVASKDAATSTKMVLSDIDKGMSSAVSITATSGATTLGLSGSAVGSGRPAPDAYLDSVNELVLGSWVIRDPVTGNPLNPSQMSAQLYIQYKALRLDVTSSAVQVGVLRISDQDTLLSVLDPLTDDNPLGLGLYLCLAAAPGFEVKGLGIDETTGAAPFGTQAAYTKAAALLESEEVYAIAPLTQDSVVHSLWDTHVLAMSEADQGGERIVIHGVPMPTTANPAIPASGTQANSTVTPGQLLIDVNPAAGLVAAGVNPSLPFSYAQGVYVEFSVGAVFYRYMVSSVSGTVLTVNTTFTSSQNLDGFYSTTPLNFLVLNSSYSLKVKGASLTIPGSNPAKLDYSLVASNVAAANASIKNRRAFSIFPDTVTLPVAGVTKSLPSFYAAASIAGMVASKPPQQGFTNYPIPGISGVVGTEKFTKRQLNQMAGGGTYILIQDSPGAAVSSRHQLSTDTTTVESRELSITKVVDFAAKFLRAGIRSYIGTEVVNKDLLDSISTTIQGMLTFLTENGVLIGANLNQIVQSKTQPDTIIVDITLSVPYPCNYIQLTLVV